MTNAPMGKSQAMLSAAFERAGAAIAMTGADGRFQFVNDRFCEIAGRPCGELLSLRLSDILDSTGAAIGPLLASVASGEHPAQEIEERLVRPDGRRVWVRNSIMAMAGGGGAFDYALVVLLEISGSACAEEKLRESEQRFRAAVDAVQGILWTNNAAGEMEGEQPGWAALTGQSYDEYQGYGWAGAVHPADAQPTIDAWKAAVAERRSFEFEHRLHRHDGEWRMFSIRAIPVFDEGGVIREWVGVHTDISRQRAAERALLDLTATLEKGVRLAMAERDRTWNNARDLLTIIDPEATIRAANPAWTTILGWTAEEIVGRGTLDFLHPEDLPAAREALSAAPPEFSTATSAAPFTKTARIVVFPGLRCRMANLSMRADATSPKRKKL